MRAACLSVCFSFADLSTKLSLGPNYYSYATTVLLCHAPNIAISDTRIRQAAELSGCPEMFCAASTRMLSAAGDRPGDVTAVPWAKSRDTVRSLAKALLVVAGHLKS